VPDADSPRKPHPQPGSPHGTGRLLPDVPAELRPPSLDRDLLTAQDERNAAEAIRHLQDKMTAISRELAEGKINQSQFQAIYTRYVEQRAIIERLLAADPRTDKWKSVAASGYSGFLRLQYEARVVGMLIIEMATARTLNTLGEFDLPRELLVPILTSLVSGRTPAFEAGTRSTLIEGGRWLSFVPGELSAAVVLFSQEPSPAQLKTITDLHRDFERINRALLTAGGSDASRMAFPYVALFE